MKKIFLAFLLALPTVAWAAEANDQKALVCLYKPMNFRFNLVNNKGIDMIQWEGGPFQAVVLNLDEKYLSVKHYANTATFRALIDPKTLIGWGEISLYSGEKTQGEIICAVD